MIPTVLSVAGSDPSGGAGIQADLKTFAALGVYGMAALTALTAQNTRGVRGVETVRPGFVADQIRAVREDVRVDAVKLGMMATAEIAEAVAGALEGIAAPVVLDPVMVAKGGAPLLADAAVAAVRARLLPRAAVVTPNLPEAARLLETAPAATRAGMAAQARGLLALGPRAVLLKGGHLEGAESPDLLLSVEGEVWLEGPRVPTGNTHGTGCTLSSALAAHLALGLGPEAAARASKRWLMGALRGADALGVGGGAGPVDHLWERRRPASGDAVS
ncbi:MAG: bifunctional hydroxymethylpyrimidine kinase/phosphomethylpyrimidine kinase [Paracoccaceae bacterium]